VFARVFMQNNSNPQNKRNILMSREEEIYKAKKYIILNEFIKTDLKLQNNPMNIRTHFEWLHYAYLLLAYFDYKFDV